MLRNSAVALPVVAPTSGASEGSSTAVRRASHPVINVQKEGDDVELTAIDDDDHEWKEANQTNTAYLWSLLLATLAECIYTCFFPDWYLPGWKVNITATMINFIGPFFDGVSYGYEEMSTAATLPLPCLQFRAAFLGVFTSYSYMVDHAGDLSSRHILAGPAYICMTIVGACLCFHVGKMLVRTRVSRQILGRAVTSKALGRLPSFMFASNAFIIITLMRALFGSPGFVQDRKEPKFIGSIRVADGEELILGIFMSCSGILISEYLEDRYRPRPDAQGRVSVIDWGNLLCNFVSCWLTCLAYEASKLSPSTIRNNVLVLKFVSCFCGSISSFSGGISHIMLLWHDGNRSGATWNLVLHILTGLLFVPYLKKAQFTT